MGGMLVVFSDNVNDFSSLSLSYELELQLDDVRVKR